MIYEIICLTFYKYIRNTYINLISFISVPKLYYIRVKNNLLIFIFAKIKIDTLSSDFIK